MTLNDLPILYIAEDLVHMFGLGRSVVSYAIASGHLKGSYRRPFCHFQMFTGDDVADYCRWALGNGWIRKPEITFAMRNFLTIQSRKEVWADPPLPEILPRNSLDSVWGVEEYGDPKATQDAEVSRSQSDEGRSATPTQEEGLVVSPPKSRLRSAASRRSFLAGVAEGFGSVKGVEMDYDVPPESVRYQRAVDGEERLTYHVRLRPKRNPNPPD